MLLCLIIVLSRRCLEKEVEVSGEGETTGLIGARLAGDMAPVGRGELDDSLRPAALRVSEAVEVRREAAGLDELSAEMRRPANLPDWDRLLRAEGGFASVLEQGSSMMSSSEPVMAESSPPPADMGNKSPLKQA